MEAKVRLRIKEIDLEVRVTGAKGPKHCQNIFIITVSVVGKNRPYVRRLREETEAVLQKPPESKFCVIFFFFLSLHFPSLFAWCLPPLYVAGP